VAFSMGRVLLDLPYIEVNYLVVAAVCASLVLNYTNSDQLLFS
jgi:hypothetical protein